jgi:hypothetical protein
MSNNNDLWRFRPTGAAKKQSQSPAVGGKSEARNPKQAECGREKKIGGRVAAEKDQIASSLRP